MTEAPWRQQLVARRRAELRSLVHCPTCEASAAQLRKLQRFPVCAHCGSPWELGKLQPRQAMLARLIMAGFEPDMLPSRMEKERRAVLAEMQMMNTIDYRVDVQLLTYLHEENALGCRFPIGLEEQIKRWWRKAGSSASSKRQWNTCSRTASC